MTAEPGCRPLPAVAASATATESLQPIGQLLATYILCEADDGLVAIDQHAAHERLLFEEMKRQYEAGAVVRQTLLFPRVIECDLDEMQLLERFSVEISALGVDIESFGGDSYVVKAVPAIVSQLPPEVIVQDFLAQLAAGAAEAPGLRRCWLAWLVRRRSRQGISCNRRRLKNYCGRCGRQTSFPIVRMVDRW